MYSCTTTTTDIHTPNMHVHVKILQLFTKSCRILFSIFCGNFDSIFSDHQLLWQYARHKSLPPHNGCDPNFFQKIQHHAYTVRFHFGIKLKLISCCKVVKITYKSCMEKAYVRLCFTNLMNREYNINFINN